MRFIFSKAALSLFVAPLLVLAVAHSAGAVEPPAGGVNPANLGKLKFEELLLTSGRTLQGLIESEDLDAVDFLEIRQPPGRHMFLVMHWHYPAARIQRTVRLPDADRRQLQAWIAAVENRDEIERAAAPKLDLRQTGDGDATTWHYGNSAALPPDKAAWLVVDSTADEETTTRAITRIEQVFAAYREILPPRTAPRRPIEIKLFATIEAYQSYLGRAGLQIENPAVFIPSKNLLAAGSELSDYSRQLAAAHKQNAAQMAKLAALKAAIPGMALGFQKKLAQGGFSAGEQQNLGKLYEAKLQRDVAEQEKEIKYAERKNDNEFENITQQMFTRLFHEAFHAYLENYVYPQADHDVPRWLNEGLAQIFEGGQLEPGGLRLDAPDAERLKRLKADLSGPTPLALAELLAADPGQFLVSHPGGAGASQRHYLYSWGLAYYLTFRQPVLETAALDHYVDREAATASPVKRFEALVGMPLDQFEAKWRAEMRKLK